MAACSSRVNIQHINQLTICTLLLVDNTPAYIRTAGYLPVCNYCSYTQLKFYVCSTCPSSTTVKLVDSGSCLLLPPPPIIMIALLLMNRQWMSERSLARPRLHNRTTQ